MAVHVSVGFLHSAADSHFEYSIDIYLHISRDWAICDLPGKQLLIPKALFLKVVPSIEIWN